MARKLIIVLLLLTSATVQAQILRNLNFQYIYNPEEAVSFTWSVVKEGNTYRAFYDLQLTDSSQFKLASVEFEIRESVSEKTGRALADNHTLKSNTATHKSGILVFQVSDGYKVLFAKVISSDSRKKLYKPFFFYKNLSTANSQYAMAGSIPVSNSYIKYNQLITFSGFEANRSVQVSYYKDAFPAAAPSFSTAQARVAKIIKPDSVFFIEPTAEIQLTQKGLYLAQQDTASAQGVAFRLEYDYPKLGTLESLAGPLIYISTKQEYEKIKNAENDKKKFDQIILSITGNTERARIFMRNYFKRVEAANEYFSSYKEGWKTDRGMIYIIYGVPDEVYLFEDREVWEYKNDYLKERFQFVKSATIFDPENYVLIREKSFANDWYNMIDLWRKARF